MLNREKHRFIMFQILKEIFENDIGKHLAFKGGTALYFLHGLDRFSTDLDFDLVDNVSVDEALESILSGYGSLKKGSKIVLSYGEEDINIKIDVSRKVWKSNRYEIMNFYGTDIRVQDKATLFSNKLVALTERNTNRDIYDVWFFFKNMFPLSEAIIGERTGKTIHDFLEDVEKKLLLLPKNYNILDGLGEVLTEKQKFFAKERLISELIGIISFYQDAERI